MVTYLSTTSSQGLTHGIGPDNQSYEVPTVLTNGHHEEIEAWKKQNALENTQKNRPDLMKNYLKKSKNE